jgi:hypothetical protein
MARSECGECGGSGWVIVERGQVSGAARCSACYQAPLPRPPLAIDSETVFDEVLAIVGELAQLNFFPTDNDGRVGIVKLIGRMASTLAEVRQLVDHMITLYNAWPGPAELRVVFCTMVGRPRDGVEKTYSGVFPGGVIPGTESLSTAPRLALVAPANRLLLEGIAKAANAHAMPALDAPRQKPKGDSIPPEVRARLEADLAAAVAERDRARRENLQRQIEALREKPKAG